MTTTMVNIGNGKTVAILHNPDWTGPTRIRFGGEDVLVPEKVIAAIREGSGDGPAKPEDDGCDEVRIVVGIGNNGERAAFIDTACNRDFIWDAVDSDQPPQLAVVIARCPRWKEPKIPEISAESVEEIPE